jgi:hypothetical protein
MKTAVVRLIVAIALFVAGAVCWAEARLTRRVAGAHERLATLHYDVDDGVDEAMTPVRLPLFQGALENDIHEHRARVQYWRARSNAPARLGDTPPALPVPGAATAGTRPGSAGSPSRNPEQMFAATNTAFRAAQTQLADRPAALVRFDAIIDAYAEVLKVDAGNADAAFNYEYVARYRDAVARTGRAPARPKDEKPADEESSITMDLPTGPTIHGRPGGPPPELPGDEFKTLVPVPADEEMEKPGEGTPRRKG